MPRTHVIDIAPDGTTRFIHNVNLKPLMDEDDQVRRAGHVDPLNPLLRRWFHLLRRLFGEKGAVAWFTRQWPCRWQVDMGPNGGPVLLATYRNRQQAIQAEIRWLERNVL